jgi:hypothetical protein
MTLITLQTQITAQEYYKIVTFRSLCSMKNCYKLFFRQYAVFYNATQHASGPLSKKKKRSSPLFTVTHVIIHHHLYQFITPHSTLNVTQLTKPPTKQVTITSHSLPIYSTLKCTYVTKYYRRPHSDTQTELNIHELTKCNRL